MNQKEAIAAGLCFGSSNAQKVLKRIRDHVLWSDNLTLDERRQIDKALLILEPIGRRHYDLWVDYCGEVNEENRRRAERWHAKQGEAA